MNISDPDYWIQQIQINSRDNLLIPDHCIMRSEQRIHNLPFAIISNSTTLLIKHAKQNLPFGTLQ
jgi:hypothetical protein